MKIVKIMPMVLILAMGVGLTGCAMFNEGTVNYSRTTTIGRELVDLEEARDKGAISEEEYTRLREDIMKGGPVEIEPWHKK